jgi:hypothetical protein
LKTILSYIENNTGNLYLRAKSTENSIVTIPDGSVELYHDNSKKLETTASGVDVTGGVNVSGVSTFQSHVNLGDNDGLYLGADQDLSIYHDGASGISWIQETGGGDLRLATNSSVAIQNTVGTAKTSAQFNPDGAVKLNHNNITKLQTHDYGIDVTGRVETDTLNISGISSAILLQLQNREHLLLVLVLHILQIHIIHLTL